MIIKVDKKHCTVQLVSDHDSANVVEHKLFFSEYVFPESYFVLEKVLLSVQEIEPHRISVEIINDDYVHDTN